MYYVKFQLFLFISYHLQTCSSDSASVSNSTLTLEEAIQRAEAVDRDAPGHGMYLRRRRRYLIFPEGSSLQVVFCLTYKTNIEIADIFYMGATASLAWQLPTDPYSPFNHHAEALHKKDEGAVVFVDSESETKKPYSWGSNVLINRFSGKPIQPSVLEHFNKNNINKFYTDDKTESSKHRKFIFSPVFAKRSTEHLRPNSKTKLKNKRASIMKIDRVKMHKNQENRKYLNAEYMNKESVEYHRFSRRGLYEKIEKLLRGMGNDGRHCVLKALCEMGQGKNSAQGSFLEEIMRVIFTLPKGEAFEDLHHQAYDDAQVSNENCGELYPRCTASIRTMPLI